MIDDPDENQKMDIFRQIAQDATYTAHTLAERYGLSDGQARSLIKIHGPSREKLDRIIAAQPFP
ncbi:hypothetical protein [Aminobacter niigataensis]|uniref:hypothetical protein n=1 Tax=Aminobacter niigataensis TaxID=83265 RepID=UPI00298EFAF4|nr:hypothetical protein [Aminobacter niigataensis]